MSEQPCVDYLLTIYQESSDEDLTALERVIDDMAAQDYPNLNFVVIHDATTPLELINRVQMRFAHNNIVCDFWEIPTECGTGYAACLKGILVYTSLSTAEYIAINQSDDPPLPQRIRRQVEMLQKHPEADLCLAAVLFDNGSGKPFPLSFKLSPENGFNQGYPSAWMLRQGNYTDYFPARFYYHEDVEFLTAFGSDHLLVIMHEPELIYSYRRAKLVDETKWNQSYHDYVAWWKTLQLRWLLSPIIERSLRVHSLMMIGYFSRNYETGRLADELEKLGLEIIRIAVDVDPRLIWDKEPNERLSASLTEGKPPIFQPIPLLPFVEKYQPDAIWYQQADELTPDFAGVTIPMIFYIHEIVWRRWPRHAENVVAIAYAFYGAVALYRNQFPLEMEGLPTLFLPYAWEPSQYNCNIYIYDKEEASVPISIIFPKHDKYFFGFMGSVGEDNSAKLQPEADPIDFHIRDWRAQYVRFAEKFCGLRVFPKGTDEQYAQFLADCNLGLNVSSNSGFINQRQFHVPGAGCVLVQNRYPGIEQIGLKDMQNCLLFSSEAELAAKIHWAELHPTEIEEIRQNGMKWAQDHTYMKRAVTVMDALEQWFSVPLSPPMEIDK